MNKELLAYMDKIDKKEFALPYHIELHPTSICNQDCVWCIMRDQRKKYAGVLTKDQLMHIAEQISVNKEIKVVFLTGGGDPLTNEHLFEKYEYNGVVCGSYFELLNKIGVQIAVSTNGEFLSRIMECEAPKFISSLRVSVDAGTEEQYALLHRSKNQFQLSELVRNIEKYYQKCHKQVELSYLLHEKNAFGYLKLADMFDIPEAINSLKVKHLIDDENRFPDNCETIIQNGISIVFEKEKEIPDGYYASQTSVLINSVGDVYPCCHLIDYGEKYLLGNVFERPLYNLFSDKFGVIKTLYCKRCAGLEVNKVFCRFHSVKGKLNDKL